MHNNSTNDLFLSVLVLGGGGREHAIASSISQSPLLKKLYTDSVNPGILSLNAEHLPKEQWLSTALDLVIVGPEKPLVDGWSDRFRESGIAVFGPSSTAAQLEGSKAFAKSVMDKCGIPTAKHVVIESIEQAKIAIQDHFPLQCVVKADGLAGGKGVFICTTAQETLNAVEELLLGRFGAAGKQIVIEEKLNGPEISLIGISDGTAIKALLPARDHKRRFDKDLGPNTGGMGAFCPVSDVSPDDIESLTAQVLKPIIECMSAMGSPFVGALYAGLMLTDDGPKVLEYNARFGDPETQAILPLLNGDWLEQFYFAATGQLELSPPLDWKDQSSCCVVLCAKSYPYGSSKGKPISISLQNLEHVFLSGASTNDNGQLVTNGGRVLSVVCLGPDLEQARAQSYTAVEKIAFEDKDYRHDIAK